MSGIKIHYSGIQQCKSNHFWGPDVRRHYVLHFVLGGKGIYRAEEKEFQIRSGEAFIINPQEFVFYKADELDPWEYAWIAFDGEDVKDLIRRLKSKDGYVFEFNMNSTIRSDFLNLVQVAKEKEIGKRKLLSVGCFYLVLSNMIVEYGVSTEKLEKDYLNKALEYIEYHYNFEIKIADISHAVGIDRTYLFRLFKKHKGISPKAYLTEYRLAIAQDMLRYTNHTTTEISMACGFHDASTLCKNFAEKFKISPQKYRKKNTEN